MEDARVSGLRGVTDGHDLRQREISSRLALQWTAAAQQNGEVSVRSRLSPKRAFFICAIGQLLMSQPTSFPRLP
jgi:hypothetical protein